MTENTPENTGKGHPPWKPGESGNPNGRPKGAKEGFEARLRRIGRSNAPDKIIKQLLGVGADLDERSMDDALGWSTYLKALSGDASARKELWDRMYGRSPQALELTGAGGGPILSVDLYDDALNDEICKRLVPGWGAEEQAEAEESATPDAE